MNKRLLTLGMGLFAAATASLAQVTFPVKMGFEEADKTEKYHCKFANNVGLSKFGDWVNPQEADSWLEQASEAAVNGDYGFLANNDVEKKNPWDRGFKLANLPIQNEHSYRMSFWLKGEPGKVMKAYISKGVEQLDKSFVNPAGQAVYGLNADQDYTIPTDEWHHVSFVAFNHGAKPYNDVLTNTSWMGGAIVGENVPEELWAGAGINGDNASKSYRDFWNGTIPEIYFAIINMYDGGQFMIDDILIEEDKYFNQATFNGDIIKLDFGYHTNIQDLAKSGKHGYLKLDANQFTVKGASGAPLEIASVEAQSDGYVYIFLNDANAENVTVSFSPNNDCPLEYAADKRPSNSSDAMKVYGFENEPTYEDTNIEAEAHIADLPELEECVPQAGSFDLPNSTNEFIFTFDIPVDVENSIIQVTNENGTVGNLDLTVGTSENVIVATWNGGELKGSYVFEMEIGNAVGDATFTEVEYSFGATAYDPSQSTDVLFDSRFDEDGNNTIPLNGAYITNEGNRLNPGEGRGSGPRVFSDFAAGGQFTAALYGRGIYGDAGSYYIGAKGAESIALEEGKHKLSFNWAIWNVGTDLNVQIFKVDDAGEISEIIKEENYSSSNTVNVGSSKNAVSGAQLVEISFEATESGNYGACFTGSNGEWLLANVQLEYLPEIAGIDYKSKLWNTLMNANDFWTSTIDEGRYDGAEYDNLYNTIGKYMQDEYPTNWAEMGMTSPDAYNEAVQEIIDAHNQAAEYKGLIDKYDALRVEGGTIEQVLANTADAKVAKLPCYTDLQNAYNQYKDNDLTNMDALKDAIAALQGNLNMVRRMNGEAITPAGTTPGGNPGLVGIKAYTHRIDIAYSTIEAISDATSYAYDDYEVNVMEQASEAVSDDDQIAEAMMKIATNKYYKAMAEGKVDNFFSPVYSEDEDNEGEQIGDGTYDFSFFLKNPFLYIVTDQEQIANSLDACPGWTFEDVQGWSTWSTGWNDFKNAEVPIEAMASNWNGSYTISQTIENLPAGLYVLKAGVSERDAVKDDSYFFWETTDGMEMMTAPNRGQTFPNYNLSSARREAVDPTTGEEVVEEGEEPQEDAEPIEILDGYLKMGAHASTNDSHIFINNFGIFLVGPSATFDYKKGYADGIENVNNNKLQSVAVFDMNGRQVVRATKGVNIVKRTYSDGSVKMDKYLVK